MESSLHTVHSIAAIANAAPFPLRWSACKVPPLRKRVRHPMCSIQWQEPAETDPHPQASSPVVKGRGPFMLPKTVIRIGAGVALALALGGAGAGTLLMARCWTPAPVVRQPALVCVLNGITRSASMKKSVESLVLRDKEAVISPDNAMKAVNLYRKYHKSPNVDNGMQLAEEFIRQREWGKAQEICQEVATTLEDDQQDPRPQLYLAVINMMQAMETMLSADPTTTDDVEKIAKEIDKMFKDAIIAWKESIKNRKEETKGRKYSST